MKSLVTISTLMFTVMFSSTSFAEWTKIGDNMDGSTFYVDFERIRKHDGYVYFWVLVDYPEPDDDGDLSGKTFKQGDCNLFRVKFLSASFHKQPMGSGDGEIETPEDPEWIYLPPKTMWEGILERVCNR